MLTFVCCILQYPFDIKITRSVFIGNTATDRNGFGGAIFTSEVGLRSSVPIESEITTEGNTSTTASKASVFVLLFCQQRFRFYNIPIFA